MSYDPTFDAQLIPSVSEGARVIKQAIVIEVIDNPVLFKEDEFLDKLFEKPQGRNTSYISTSLSQDLRRQIKQAPRNSIIGYMADSDPSQSEPMIFYPFFSQHIALPLKPGENVWIISEGLLNSFSVTRQDPSNNSLSSSTGDLLCSGFWMSRVTVPDYTDDVNFTHSDRSRSQEYVQQQKPPASTFPPPHFHNGSQPSSIKKDGRLVQNVGDPDFYTLPQDNDYERVYADSLANKRTTREPVPSFNKRPGDILIQGSNNALICIGEDRPTPPKAEFNGDYVSENPLTQPRKDGMAGTIDLVAGRCIVWNGEALEFDSKRITTVANDREETEKEKRPWALVEGQSSQKVREGDVDFLNDLTRIYASMKTDGDKNFGYDSADDNSFEFKALPVPAEGNPLNPVDQKPYAVIKSNELRFIARKNDDNDIGSIRIIKEGARVSETDPGDQAIISMQPNGDTLIDAPQIILGLGRANDQAFGEGNQVFIGGADATESLVLGTKLHSLLKKLVDAIVNNAPNFVATGTGPGILNPTIVSTATEVKTEIDQKTFLSKVGKTK